MAEHVLVFEPRDRSLRRPLLLVRCPRCGQEAQIFTGCRAVCMASTHRPIQMEIRGPVDQPPAALVEMPGDDARRPRWPWRRRRLR